MKVLLTATVQSHICQFHRPLADLLHARGCEVHAAARDNLAEKNGLKLNFADKVFDVPFSRSPVNRDNIRAYAVLKKIIDEGHYDVIHCNTPVGGVITRLAARDARRNGAKVFYTAHGFHFYRGAPPAGWLLYYPIEKLLAEHCTDRLITVNGEDERLARKKFRCQVERIHGAGVDERRYFPAGGEEKRKLRRQMGYMEGQKLLLCTGELRPNKNQRMAVRVMAELLKDVPDAALLIAGNGPEKENIEKLVRELRLEAHVKLIGYVTNLEDYQRIADIGISCSGREGLPLNIVESMLSGTPVVATDNRGHRELIRNGVNGYLVPRNDTEAMTERVKTLLADRELYESFAENGIRSAEVCSRKFVTAELGRIYFGLN